MSALNGGEIGVFQKFVGVMLEYASLGLGWFGRHLNQVIGKCYEDHPSRNEGPEWVALLQKGADPNATVLYKHWTGFHLSNTAFFSHQSRSSTC
jgi:hypothetical protein